MVSGPVVSGQWSVISIHFTLYRSTKRVTLVTSLVPWS